MFNVSKKPPMRYWDMQKLDLPWPMFLLQGLVAVLIFTYPRWIHYLPF